MGKWNRAAWQADYVKQRSVNVYLEPSRRQELVKRAKKEGKSLSAMGAELIERGLEDDRE